VRLTIAPTEPGESVIDANRGESKVNDRWYVSFHGGEGGDAWNNIHLFSEDGQPLGTALETNDLPKSVALRELRGFAFGPDGELYVANAYKDASQILRFHGRPNDAGKHAISDVFAERHDANRGLAHPFDVAFGPDGNLYVPSQDTSIVGRYHGPKASAGAPGTPMDHPPALRDYPPDTFHPGTFVPSARHVPTGLEEVRHALFGPDGHLYVADRNANRVKRYDGVTGELLGELGDDRLGKPVHLLFRDDATLLVGSREGDAVLALDPVSGRLGVLIEPGAGGLREPAGLAFGADGMLYVASRGSRQVLRFDPRDGRPDNRPFLDGLKDRPEFLRLVGNRPPLSRP
jgi:DNA-binding beta-propeller fold protein YncE